MSAWPNQEYVVNRYIEASISRLACFTLEKLRFENQVKQVIMKGEEEFEKMKHERSFT